MSGQARSLNMPSALTTTSASTGSPDASSTVHELVGSFQVARTTSLSKRQCGRIPYLVAQNSMYARISGCVAYGRVQSGLISNEYE